MRGHETAEIQSQIMIYDYVNFISQVERLIFGTLYVDIVIHVESLNSFKTRLGKFWNRPNQDIILGQNLKPK